MERAFGQDDWVCTELTSTGTNTGPFQGPEGPGGETMPATHKPVRVPFCLVLKAEGGKFTEVHQYVDRLGQLTQLGLKPTPQPVAGRTPLIPSRQAEHRGELLNQIRTNIEDPPEPPGRTRMGGSASEGVLQRLDGLPHIGQNDTEILVELLRLLGRDGPLLGRADEPILLQDP